MCPLETQAQPSAPVRTKKSWAWTRWTSPSCSSWCVEAAPSSFLGSVCAPTAGSSVESRGKLAIGTQSGNSRMILGAFLQDNQQLTTNRSKFKSPLRSLDETSSRNGNHRRTRSMSRLKKRSWSPCRLRTVAGDFYAYTSVS